MREFHGRNMPRIPRAAVLCGQDDKLHGGRGQLGRKEPVPGWEREINSVTVYTASKVRDYASIESGLRRKESTFEKMADSARRKFNRKRAMIAAGSNRDFSSLAESVRYGGNPVHKGNPGNFRLHPPSAKRPDKSVCDNVGIYSRMEALRLLREGVKRGLISKAVRGKFPKNIWAVTDDGHPLEAILENQSLGTYHGYPVQQDDPFRSEVLKRWAQS